MNFKDLSLKTQFSETTASRLSFGQLEIFSYPSEGEYQIEWTHTSSLNPFYLGEEVPESKVPNGANRLILGNKKETLKFQIALPDRPVVLKSAKPIKIPSKGRSQLYVFIPCFIQLLGKSHFKSVFFEKASLPLHQTWLGDMETGSLGYYLNSSFYLEPENLENKYHLALCALNIHNSSKVDLEFDKLALPVPQMQLFQGSKSFYTNEILVEYEAELDGIEVKLKKFPPDLEEGITSLRPPRETQESGIFKNTWDVFYKIAKA